MPSEYYKIYTKEQGLSSIVQLSQKEYSQINDFLNSCGREFGSQNYDPCDIKYVNSIGRYYIYELDGFNGYPILFNKYTGEIYGNNTGRPPVFISKGFPNISFMYQ